MINFEESSVLAVYAVSRKSEFPLNLITRIYIEYRFKLSSLKEFGLEQFSVSPRPLGFGFGTQRFGAKGLGPGLDNFLKTV